MIKILLDFFSPYIKSNLGKIWEEVIMTFLIVVIKKTGKKHCTCVSDEDIWNVSQS